VFEPCRNGPLSPALVVGASDRLGETEGEVLRNVAEHAKEHGILEVTPEMMERVKANIKDA
jgi:predicted small metal-binding protein